MMSDLRYLYPKMDKIVRLQAISLGLYGPYLMSFVEIGLKFCNMPDPRMDYKTFTISMSECPPPCNFYPKH